VSDDFVHDLELELTAAARRHASARSRRLPALPHPRRLIPAVVFMAVVAALVTAVALLARSDTENRAAAPAPPGTAPAGCVHRPSDELVERLPDLARPADASLPAAARAVLTERQGNFAAIEADRAALWGERDGVAVWIVPVVSREAEGACAPADGACLVMVADGDADVHCRAPLATDIRWSPFPGGTFVLGFPEHGATGVRVVSGREKAEVPARDGVLAGLVPFPVDSPPVFQTLR
jgi:hypothetical protein